MTAPKTDEEWARSAEAGRIAARKRRFCNCISPTADEQRRGYTVTWHPHGSRSTCPPKPPVQEVCSPSLSATGSCHCPRHRDEYTDMDGS